MLKTQPTKEITTNKDRQTSYTKPYQHLKVKPKSMQQDDDIMGCLAKPKKPRITTHRS